MACSSYGSQILHSLLRRGPNIKGKGKESNGKLPVGGLHHDVFREAQSRNAADSRGYRDEKRGKRFSAKPEGLAKREERRIFPAEGLALSHEEGTE